MKRKFPAVMLLCLALLTPMAMAATEGRWEKLSPNGDFVTVRIEFPQGKEMRWADQRWIVARYADTGETVPLCDYYDGAVYATVPVTERDRPLKAVAAGEPKRFTNYITPWNGVDYYDPPDGTEELALRGILQGDGSGALPKGNMTRAQAFAMIVRTLGLQSEVDPGLADIKPGDWYYGVAAAAKAYGLTNQSDYFYPDSYISREDWNVLAYRAFRMLGWLQDAGEEAWEESRLYVDRDQISSYAVEAYQAFMARNIYILSTAYSTEVAGGEYLQPQAEFSKEEAIRFLEAAVRFLPVYPSREAIDLGFDREMPRLDGSTSTYPYTSALYTKLFYNCTNHPQYPKSHSKSHQSYERLIGGEMEALFAATEPSEELKRQAESAGVELVCVPIAYDAMVFFTNVENPAEGLTREQLQAIYVDNAYQNWSQVGGEAAALLPYSRNLDSGSHALMERYVLDGGTHSIHKDILAGNVSKMMSTALTDVAAALQTDPPAYALGYSVYYYYLNASRTMLDVTDNELKLLAIDGVAPTEGTIADRSYPLADYNYLVYRGGGAENAPECRLAEWMLTPEGQQVVEIAGFGKLAE